MLLCRKILFIIASICLPAAAFAQSFQPEQHYVKIESPVEQAPEVVEFFSFYCGPCYSFAYQIKVDVAIRNALPQNSALEKYHVSQMGPLGRELTEAWAIAKYAGIQTTIEKSLFEGVQEKHNIHTVEDIKHVFALAGINAEKYAEMQSNIVVKSYLAKQEKLMEQLGVTGTPSFYVSGKYRIINSSLDSDSYADYARQFAQLVLFLLNDRA